MLAPLCEIAGQWCGRHAPPRTRRKDLSTMPAHRAPPGPCPSNPASLQGVRERARGEGAREARGRDGCRCRGGEVRRWRCVELGCDRINIDAWCAVEVDALLHHVGRLIRQRLVRPAQHVCLQKLTVGPELHHPEADERERHANDGESLRRRCRRRALEPAAQREQADEAPATPNTRQLHQLRHTCNTKHTAVTITPQLLPRTFRRAGEGQKVAGETIVGDSARARVGQGWWLGHLDARESSKGNKDSAGAGGGKV